MNQDIEVLGTHFNINSYEDEDVIKTTLLEGAVRIKTQEGQVVLKPNQQSRLGKKGLYYDVNIPRVVRIIVIEEVNYIFPSR